MKKIIALTLSTLLAGAAFAQMPAQMPAQQAQPVAPAVVGRTLSVPQASHAVVKKAKSGKKAVAKKSKKSGKKLSVHTKSSKLKASKKAHKIH